MKGPPVASLGTSNRNTKIRETNCSPNIPRITTGISAVLSGSTLPTHAAPLVQSGHERGTIEALVVAGARGSFAAVPLSIQGDDRMAELEPGHPDELVQILGNWLRQGQSPHGSLPGGMDPVEWAVRQFIKSWSTPVRGAIEEIEGCLRSALESIRAGNLQDVQLQIETARQLVEESLRDELGLYEWNKE